MILALVAGCSDPGLTKYNTPPNASVLEPADGASFNPGDLVEFKGIASDSQDVATELLITWTSSLDGTLGTDPPDVSGNVYLATNALSSGEHVISMQVVDTQAEAAEATLLVNVGEGDNTEGAPTVVLLGPSAGGEYAWSDGVNVLGTVTDDADPYETLFVEILDVPDGTVWTGNPSSTGTLDATVGLSEGAHSLTVKATDSEGHTGSATVDFSVLADDRPQVSITEPADGSSFDLGSTITFRGTVSDDVSDPEELSIRWESDSWGLFSTASPDSSGETIVSTTLPAGTHTISLQATDADGKDGSDSIVLTVADPLDRDDDGDSYTENDGDCDDADSAVNPGTADLCDDVDNDCDGQLNDPYWDAYEPDDAQSSAWDAGEVSGFLWTSSTLEMAGRTLSDAEDADWVIWDAEDEFLIDNVEITVTAKGFSGDGNYVLELWSRDTGSLVDSDSGFGSLSVSYSGDSFDEDEDLWAVVVYAADWPDGSCSTTYDLTVSS